jgi:Asp/Glu/hydantoin racemase
MQSPQGGGDCVTHVSFRTMSSTRVPRVALIHALAESVAPVNAAMEREWPVCRRMNVMDDSLSADLAASGALDEAMTQRFIVLGDYAAATGCDGILFTCSAFGPCIDAVAARLAPLPVLKPNEAMIRDAGVIGGRIGLLATFAPTIASMTPEFPPGTDLRTAFVPGALDALRSGDRDRHDALIATAARQLASEGCQVLALAQFSMARAGDAVAADVAVPVLTTLASAVRELKERVLLSITPTT